MPDEIEVTQKSNSESTTAVTGGQTSNLARTHLINLCAAGLGASFFLPWVQIFDANLSGFELQKMGDEQLLLWAIPVFSGITIIAGLAKRSQKIIGQLTGLLPFAVGVYWYSKLGNDLFKILTYGAFLSLICGAAIFILPRKSK